MATHSTTIVMISSTVLDLDQHRQKVLDACLRVGMVPRMMEHLSANPKDAIANSLALVDAADIYLGIFGFRYGYIPPGHDKSITQIEYERAVERGIPQLLFEMDEHHPLLAKDVETGHGAERMKLFKESICNKHFVAKFRSPDDLVAQVINGLMDYRLNNSSLPGASTSLPLSWPAPPLPQPFAPQPYTLLVADELIGRHAEIKQLNDWSTNSAEHRCPLLLLIAIGGTGKSALCWSWFKSLSKHQWLKGRMWWSFYEPTATFERFLFSFLAYAKSMSAEEARKRTLEECEVEVLTQLETNPFVLVLDGIERLMQSYARSHEPDDERVEYRRGEQKVAKPADQRSITDRRFAKFLRKLSQIDRSKVLITSRLLPVELEKPDGKPIAGCEAIWLDGLSNNDAIELWHACGCRGSAIELIQVFNLFRNHALLIQILASEVARYREGPGDFKAWQRGNPTFDPLRMPITSVRSHVLEHAIKNLSDSEWQLLRIVASSRLPSSWETLRTLLVANSIDDKGKPFTQTSDLGEALSALQARGLVGWDRMTNRYEMHPIVRGVTLNSLDDSIRMGVYQSLEEHFQAMPRVEDFRSVRGLDDLTSQIERFNSLIALGRTDEAFQVYAEQLGPALCYRLGNCKLRKELLNQLASQDSVPLADRSMQFYIQNAIAQCEQMEGNLAQAGVHFDNAVKIAEEIQDDASLSVALGNTAYLNLLQGKLLRAKSFAVRALQIDQKTGSSQDEACSLFTLCCIAQVTGQQELTSAAFHYSDVIRRQQSDSAGILRNQIFQANLCLNSGDSHRVFDLLKGMPSADNRTLFDEIAILRLEGQAAALFQDDYALSESKLGQALQLAVDREVLEEELTTLLVVATLDCRRGNYSEAKSLVEDLLSRQLEGFRLVCAEAHLILGDVQASEKNSQAAVCSYETAYRLAWCDGPPYSYASVLNKSEALIKRLGGQCARLESTTEPAVLPIKIPGWSEENS